MKKAHFYIVVACAVVLLVGEVVLYFVESMPVLIIASVAGTYLALASMTIAPDTMRERVYTVLGGLIIGGFAGLIIAIWWVAPAGEVPLFMVVVCGLLALRGAAAVVSAFWPSRE